MKSTRLEGRRPHSGFCCEAPRTHPPAPSRVLLQRPLPAALLLRIALSVRHIPSPTAPLFLSHSSDFPLHTQPYLVSTSSPSIPTPKSAQQPGPIAASFPREDLAGEAQSVWSRRGNASGAAEVLMVSRS